MTSAQALGVAANMTDLQHKVIAACEEKACSAAELVDAFGVSRWYVYDLARKGILKNVTDSHECARYIATGERKKEDPRYPPRHRKWRIQAAILQVPSIWHYAERMK